MVELPGECQHADRFAFQLIRLMDFSSTSSINCSGVKTDWHSSIEFLKRNDSTIPILKFTGKPGPDPYSLEVTGVIEFRLDPEPASGRCQMFRADDPAGKREIACFVKQKNGSGEPQASLVRFTVDDELLGLGEIKQYSGTCSPSRVSEIVMKEAVARVYEGYRPIEFLPSPSCDNATMVGGKSVSLENSGNPKSKLVFSGVVEGDDVNRILVKMVGVGENEPKTAIAGVCSGIRRMDGFLHTLCSAAFEEDGKIKAISVEFPEPMPIED